MSRLFSSERQFQQSVHLLALAEGFAAFREQAVLMLGSVSFVDVVIEYPDGSWAYTVECKIYPGQSELQRAIGQCMSHKLIPGVMPVLCLPSDAEVDPDLAALCEQANILLCSEKTLGAIVKSHCHFDIWSSPCREASLLNRMIGLPDFWRVNTQCASAMSGSEIVPQPVKPGVG